MKKYAIVSGRTIGELEAKVSEYLCQGWDVAGGCAIDPKPVPGSPWVFQAITKNEKDRYDRKLSPGEM